MVYLSFAFAHSIEARCWVGNEDVVGAAPTGDAPTTSRWSTIILPTMVRLYCRFDGTYCKLNIDLWGVTNID